MVILAPMDGYTNPPYRQIIKEQDPRTILFTEFVSADGIIHESKHILRELTFDPEIERPIVAQIFGKDPEVFGKAAKVIEKLGFDAVDVNMGCPSKKVVNHMHGSALMKDIDNSCRIIEAMKNAVSIPVSVKTRLGWDNADNLIPFIKRLENEGLDLVTIHGRTYSQAFKGAADWGPIYELKKQLTIPVVGNGDIVSVESVKEKLGNLDGVMVGRGTFGNPWLLKEIASYLYDGVEWDHQKEVTLEDRLQLMTRHCQKLYEYRGDGGLRMARKHLVTYLSHLPGIKEFRKRLVLFESLEELAEIFDDLRATYIT